MNIGPSEPRLIPYLEGLDRIAVKSPKTGKKLIESGALPHPIMRGRFKYFLESDIQRYVAELVRKSTGE